MNDLKRCYGYGPSRSETRARRRAADLAWRKSLQRNRSHRR